MELLAFIAISAFGMKSLCGQPSSKVVLAILANHSIKVLYTQ